MYYFFGDGKVEFSAALLQSSVSHDPFRKNSKMLIWCSKIISYYYQCWKQLCYLIFPWGKKNQYSLMI